MFAMPWLIAIGANLNTCHRFNFQVEKHRFFSPNISELPVYLAPRLKYLINKNCNNIQLFLEGEVNSGGYIPRREASRYISTALHRP